MSLEVTLLCIYKICDSRGFKIEGRLPKIPKTRTTFFSDEIDSKTEREIIRHHFDTGVEMEVNNRHGGHQSFEVYVDSKLIGYLNKRWGQYEFCPLIEG